MFTHRWREASSIRGSLVAHTPKVTGRDDADVGISRRRTVEAGMMAILSEST
jgi:hypothetical protein